jgi:hypothetical protein
MVAERAAPAAAGEADWRTVNRLTLERHVYIREGHDRSTATVVVVPVIDGTPLHDMVDDRSPGLEMRYVAPPSRQWLGAPDYTTEGLTVILDGSCGEAECCGVAARVTMTDDTVVWSEFFARGRPPLPPGLRFEFDPADYEATVEAATTAPERIWTVGNDGDA